jgi:hypothetical protein
LKMPPPPKGADISDLSISQDGTVTTTVNVSKKFTITVTSEFGETFPPVGVVIKVAIADLMTFTVLFSGGAVFTASPPNHVSVISVPPLLLGAPGDVCCVNVSLLATITATPHPPITSVASASFVAF